MLYTVFWLALTFGLHIMLVNLGIFLALYVPYLKWKADKEGDEGLEKVAYKLMRFYAATYGVAGVFATAFTVFLLSYYPNFLGLAGNIALIPFGIAITMIVLHFFSIATFYYGWYRWSRPVHYTLGFLLALSGILIPLGFRAVFAFLNIPVGLHFAGGKPYLNVSEALGNPTLWPLYFKSLVAAITAGSLAVAGGLAYSYHKSEDQAYKAAVNKVLSQLAPVALAGLVIMFFLGLWYAITLEKIPYKFNNVFASLGWKVGDGIAHYNVAWVFVLKMILYVFQFAVIIAVYKYMRSGSMPFAKAKLLLYGGLAALATVMLGEWLNAFSQYPYFIACLGSPQSCQSILAEIPKDQLPYIAKILSLEHVNQLALISSVKMITNAFMLFLLASVVYFFYVYFFKPEKA